MQPAQILVDLRRILAATDAPFVLTALAEDPLVWNALHQPEFLESLPSDERTASAFWSPANLSLRSFANQVNFSDLTAEHIPAIEANLRKQALELLETTLRTSQPPATLAQAGLLALALRERRRKTKSWRGLLSELTTGAVKSPTELIKIWQTPLACLYGIIPDKWDFLESLLPQDSMHPSIEWISHIILTDPIDSESQGKLFQDLMGQLVVDYQVEWLRYLTGKGRYALAAGIADQLLTSNRDFLTILDEDFNPNHAEWVTTSRKVLDYQLAATLYQISGRPLKAGAYLDRTRGILKHWLTGSSMQMVNMLERNQLPNDGVTQDCSDFLTRFPISDGLKNEALFVEGNSSTGTQILAGSHGKQSLISQILKPQTKLSPENVENTKRIVQDWVSEITNHPEELKGQFVFDLNPMPILDNLAKQDMESEAILLAEKILEVRSEDAALLSWLADASHRLGQDEKALEYRLRLVLLQPDELAHIRKLADLHEDRQEWNAAIQERRLIIQSEQMPDINDLLALAACAIKANSFDEAFETCNAILGQNPEHGMAYTLLGKVCMAKADIDTAITHLERAVVLIPEAASPWFELAEAYRRNGDISKVIQTLREAVLTAPDSSELHYALGKAYLDSDQMSDALPFLRQSARLAPESVEVALSLAEALITLGYRQEALVVVEKARARWRIHPGLAYLHAKMLLKEGNEIEGLEVLEVALQSESPAIEWYLLSARTLIGDSTAFFTGGPYVADPARLNRALKSLQKALVLAPQFFESRVLLAEALLLRGDNDQAFEAYRTLIDLPEAVQDEWYWRVQAGFGHAAMNIGQVETALASLQNAVTANPNAVGLQRYLAEAFTKADLKDSAAQTAEQVLALAPEDVEILTWYAGLMAQIGHTEAAISALRTALDLNPESIDIRLKQAEILLMSSDQDAARHELAVAAANPSASSAELRRTAHLYLSIGEELKALSVLEKSVKAIDNPDFRTLFELAVLYKNAGNHNQALETIEKAIQLRPEDVASRIVEADIQEKTNRSQAALESLEAALKISRAQPENSPRPEQSSSPLFAIKTTPADIHILLTQVHQKLGNLNEALNHAENAIKLCPESNEIRFIGAETASKLLLNEQALKLMTVEGSGDVQESTGESAIKDPWLAGLYCMQAEHALECNDNQAASKLISQGLVYDPDSLRLSAAEIFLAVRTGDWTKAEEAFSALWGEISPVLTVKAIRSLSDNRRISIPDGTLLAAAEAAVELYRWDDANRLIDYVVRSHPAQPLALLRQLATMVRAAEWYFTGSKIGAITHLPDETVVSEDAALRFEQALEELKKLSQSSEIERWKIRGNAVFHPTLGAVRDFTSRALAAEDSAALVMVLNRIGNPEGAQQVGEQYNAHPLVNIQLSLVEGLEPSENNQKAGARAVSLMPNNPVCHAALAVSADKNGDLGRALEAIETALVFWPNESGWQYLAAKLALSANEMDAARLHLEKTHALMPANLDVSLELGNIYQTLREFSKAVAVLQKAVQIAPNNPTVWLAFAKALNLNQQPADALKAASQAAQLGGDENYKGLVMTGEILLGMGDDKKAMDYARQAEKLAPMQPETRLLSCKILAARGREKDALAELNRACDDLPGVLDLEIERARLVNKLHGANAAIQVLQPMAESHTENDVVVGMYAKALADANRPIEAERTALQALRINPNKSDTHILLGRLFTKSGQLDKAVHHLSESARIDPTQSEAFLELGEVYINRRDYAQALDAYKQAMEAVPDDFRPYYQAGLILRDGKDYQGAENMLRRAAALAPQDVNIRRQLGAIVALNLVHNCQEANSCL